jgi:hypothetical protein
MQRTCRYNDQFCQHSNVTRGRMAARHSEQSDSGPDWEGFQIR